MLEEVTLDDEDQVILQPWNQSVQFLPSLCVWYRQELLTRLRTEEEEEEVQCVSRVSLA